MIFVNCNICIYFLSEIVLILKGIFLFVGGGFGGICIGGLDENVKYFGCVENIERYE